MQSCRLTTRTLAVWCLVWWTPPAGALGHMGVHEEIELITAKLAKDPGNAELYMKRGDLHRIHRDWKAAAGDFARARQLDPDLEELDLREGRMLLEAEKPALAADRLSRFLEVHPRHVRARLLRGRAFAAQELYRRAVAEYDLALSLFEGQGHARPEVYLDRARAQSALGGDSIEAAIRGLDEGVARLGSLVVLERCAIDLELRRGNHAAALARAERAARTGDKGSWLARQGQILEAWGREDRARDVYRKALAELRARSRKTPAAEELKLRLEADLARLSEAAAKDPGESRRVPADPR